MLTNGGLWGYNFATSIATCGHGFTLIIGFGVCAFWGNLSQWVSRTILSFVLRAAPLFGGVFWTKRGSHLVVWSVFTLLWEGSMAFSLAAECSGG